MKIFIIDGKKKEMSYDELLEQFEDMLYQRSYRFLEDHQNKALLELEDVMQNARIALWEAMSTYDVSYNTHFSTHLHYQILSRFKVLSQEVSAEFRNNMHEVSIEGDVRDVDKIDDLSELELSFRNIEFKDWLDSLDLSESELQTIEHIISGRTQKESAELYDLPSRKTLSARQCRLCKKLKDNFEKGVIGYDFY